MNVLQHDSYGAIFIKLYDTVTLFTNIFMFYYYYFVVKRVKAIFVYSFDDI